MGTIGTETKKGIIQSTERKTARKDTSVAVSWDHNEYLDGLAKICKESKKIVLAKIIQFHKTSHVKGKD